MYFFFSISAVLITNFISCIIHLIQLGTSASNKGASVGKIVSVIVLYYYTLRNNVLMKGKIMNSTSKLKTDALEHTMIALLS